MLLKFVKRRRTSSSWEGVLLSWGPWGRLLREVGTSTPGAEKKGQHLSLACLQIHTA